MGKVHNQQRSTPSRRTLRQNLSEPEQRLWYHLRDKRLQGSKWRRQQSFGKYVVDFYCAQVRLAVEIDGDSHFTDEAEVYDNKRTAYLNTNGIQVLRYTNHDVMHNIERVLTDIAARLPSP